MNTNSAAITLYHTSAGSFVVSSNGVWVRYEEWLRDPRLAPGWVYANP